LQIDDGIMTQGRRNKGLPVPALSNRSLISVITVVYNDEKHIENTILSVLKQTHDHVEYIIVDGGSSDETINIIKKYGKKIDYWVSEPDDGIYSAMNKGVAVAKGDWIIFINSGDIFYNDSALSCVVNQISDTSDVVYGQCLVAYASGVQFKKLPRDIEDMWKGTVSSHQSILIRSNLMKKYYFDCTFSLAADHELLSKLFHSGCRFQYLQEIIAVVSASGVSDTKRFDVYNEFSRVSKQYFAQKPFRCYFFIRQLDCFLRIFVKKFMPTSIIERIRTIRTLPE